MSLSKVPFSNTTLENLGGTTHSQTGLAYIPKRVDESSDPPLYARLNNQSFVERELVAGDNIGLRAEQLNDGLKIGVHAGYYVKTDGTKVTFSEVSSYTLTSSSTNYVYILVSSNALTHSTTGWPASESDYYPIAIYTTSTVAITNTDADADRRSYTKNRIPPASTSSGVTTSETFTIDSDNASAGVNTGLNFNRGSTANDAQLLWDETNDKFIVYSDKDTPTKAKLDCLEVQISGTTMLDSNGVAKVATAAAGDGLASTAGVLSVNVDGSSIEISSDALRVKAGGVTTAMLSATAQDALAIVSIPNGSGSSPLDVTVQVQDFAGNALAEVCYLRLLIAEDADGAANASDEVLTVPTTGSIVRSLTAGKDIFVKTNSSGQVVVRITTSTPGTSYLLASPYFRSKFLHCAGYGTITIS